MEQSLSSEEFSPLTSERSFKFCLPDVAAGRILPQLAEIFQKEAPKIQAIAVSTSKGDLEKLKNQELDFIITSDEALRNDFKSPLGQKFDEYFNSFVIYKDRPQCVGRKDNPFFEDGKISNPLKPPLAVISAISPTTVDKSAVPVIVCQEAPILLPRTI